MRSLSRLLLLIFVFVAKISFAEIPENVGLFLSFEQRLAATYALLAQGENIVTKEEILSRGKKYFLAASQKNVQTVVVKNFAEFLNEFKGPWPNTHSVALDLNLIEKNGPRALRVFKADSPRVQRQIDRYIEWQQNQLLEMATVDKNLSHLSPDFLSPQNSKLMHNPLSQKWIEGFVLQQSEAILNEHMKELDRVGEKMAQSSFAQQQDATMRIFMQTLFGEYFSRLSPASRKLIVSSYLGENLFADDLKKFEIMVQNSGPQLQKLLQVVAREADLSPEMLDVFKTLENSVRPVPWVQVEEILKTEKGNFDFIYFEKKSLGVGTMAQVHRAKILIKGQRQDVVVRFIKPGIAARVEEDRLILSQVANILDVNPEFRNTGAPRLGPIIDDITATVTAELNQKETIDRQQLAKIRYEKSIILNTPEYKNQLEFHVPSIFPGKGPSQFMVQELITGKKLDKESKNYAEVVPKLKQAIVEEMAKVWAYEVLFGAGFYHSDLHQGNFMVNVTDPKIQVNILDYGMGGTISSALQKQVMVLGAGIELNNTEMIFRAFWKMSQIEKNTINETQFRSLVQERMQLIQEGKETKISIENWTAWAMDNGLRLPYEFISLNRGMVIVNKLLKESGSTQSVTSIMKAYGRSHPALIYKVFVIEEKLSHSDLLKLGWSEIKRLLPSTEAVGAAVRCEMVFQ